MRATLYGQMTRGGQGRSEELELHDLRFVVDRSLNWFDQIRSFDHRASGHAATIETNGRVSLYQRG